MTSTKLYCTYKTSAVGTTYSFMESQSYPKEISSHSSANTQHSSKHALFGVVLAG